MPAGIALHPVSRHHEARQRMLEAGRARKGLGVIHRARKRHEHRLHERGNLGDGIVAPAGRPLRRDARAALRYTRFAYRLAVVANDGVDRCPCVVTPLI
jgi:hypothetical protein